MCQRVAIKGGLATLSILLWIALIACGPRHPPVAPESEPESDSLEEPAPEASENWRLSHSEDEQEPVTVDAEPHRTKRRTTLQCKDPQPKPNCFGATPECVPNREGCIVCRCPPSGLFDSKNRVDRNDSDEVRFPRD